MRKIETLTAYKCTFNYLRRNNPLKKELENKIKEGKLPDYTFKNFINDFSQFTSSLIVGNDTGRAILLPNENIYLRLNQDDEKIYWRIVPYAGKHGKPLRIIKTSTGKEYNFGSDSAALYQHNIFIYSNKETVICIFHRQSGSGCKSVFLETANQMLRKKGIKLEMELYLPLTPLKNDYTPTKIQLQYIRSIESSDIADNLHKGKRLEVIQELGFNLESKENSVIKNILLQMKLGKINQDVAFAKIKKECSEADIYNDAEIYLRVGKRRKKVRWNEFESILGTYDITDELYEKYKISHDFIIELTKLADGYYNNIMKEDANAK